MINTEIKNTVNTKNKDMVNTSRDKLRTWLIQVEINKEHG